MANPAVPAPKPDPAVQAMQSASWLSLTQSLAVAQTVDRLAGLLVNEGLTKMVRQVLLAPGACPPNAAATAPEAKQGGEGDADGATACAPTDGRSDLSNVSARVLNDMLTQSVINRLAELQEINGMLALVGAEQLRGLSQARAEGPDHAARGGQTPLSGPPHAPGQPPMPPFGQAPMPIYGQPPMPAFGQPPMPAYGQPPLPAPGQAVLRAPDASMPSWAFPAPFAPPLPYRLPVPYGFSPPPAPPPAAVPPYIYGSPG